MVGHLGIFAKALATLLLLPSVQGQYVAVAGVKSGVNTATGARPARQNIVSFASTGAPWDLYVQALAAFQNDSQSQPLSYYQIAGIHGRPYASWDNINGEDGDFATGYCTHDSILFPVWHRPYLALYESALFNHVRRIADTYTGSQAKKYQQAALTWRMPYWDWASTPQMPSTVTSPSIRITGPSGLLTMPNPLYSYKFDHVSTADFPANAQDAPKSILTAPQTWRDANGSGVSNEVYVNQQLMSAGLTKSVYDVFTQATQYSDFATQANSDASIEAVHGTIHVTVGQGNGHMTYIPYSAFDPIFFLHHTNVDRIFAMWQAIYPDTYVTPQENTYGTFTQEGGTTEDQYTDLAPFTSRTDGSTFWNSVTSRELKNFGYTYPEIQDWNHTGSQLQASVRKSVNALYNPGGTKSKRSLIDSRIAGVRQDLFSIKEWYASVSVDKCAVGGPFKIFMFFGPPPKDTTKWATSPNMLGMQGYFSPVAPAGSQPRQLVHSQISLQGIFSPKTGLTSTVAEFVVPFLTKHLQWGVQKADGTVVPNTDIPSLNIVVHEKDVTPAQDCDSFPIFGPKTMHPEITLDKLFGGSSWRSVI